MNIMNISYKIKLLSLPCAVTGFDINKLSQEAQTRWLKPVEVLYILQNYKCSEITQKPPQKPPSK